MESWEQFSEEHGGNNGAAQHRKMSFNPIADQTIPAATQMKATTPIETAQAKRIRMIMSLYFKETR